MQDQEKKIEFLGQLPGFENVYKVLPSTGETGA